MQSRSFGDSGDTQLQPWKNAGRSGTALGLMECKSPMSLASLIKSICEPMIGTEAVAYQFASHPRPAALHNGLLLHACGAVHVTSTLFPVLDFELGVRSSPTIATSGVVLFHNGTLALAHLTRWDCSIAIVLMLGMTTQKRVPPLG